MVSLTAERPQITQPVELEPCRAPARDEAWFDAFYESSCGYVYRCALMFTHDAAQAEDVAAETYLRAWRARERFEDRGSPKAWLLSITRHCALDLIRKRSEVVDLDISDLEISAESSSSELSTTDISAIHVAISHLTAEQQHVIFLRFYEELPHEAVAQKLGRNPNAVRAIQFRALSRLRKLLEAERAI